MEEETVKRNVEFLSIRYNWMARDGESQAEDVDMVSRFLIEL